MTDPAVAEAERALVGLRCPAGCTTECAAALDGGEQQWPGVHRGVVVAVAQENLCALQDTPQSSACDVCGTKATDAQLCVLQQASAAWVGLQEAEVTEATLERMVEVLEV